MLGGQRGLVVATFVSVLALGAAGCGGSAGSKSGAPASPSSGRTRNTAIRTASTPPIAPDVVPAGAKRLHFKVGPITIEPGQNNIYTQGRIPQPTGDGWIVGMHPDLRYPDGTVPPVDVIHLHHGVWLNLRSHDSTSGLPERFFAAGEEKTQMVLPKGYGYQFNAADHWVLNMMLHNITPTRATVFVTYDVDFIPANSPAAKGIIPARPIWMDVQNGSIYPVFDVLRGSGTNGRYTFPDDAKDPYGTNPPRNEWTVDADGVLIATAGHVHPGGLQTDLWLQRNGATAPAGKAKAGHADTAHLYTSTAHYFEPAGNVSWDLAATGTQPNWAVSVKKGDKLSISATYDSKTATWYESMGIMVVWMAAKTNGTNAFQTSVDTAGLLTHGHLPENNNHGGKADPSHFTDLTKAPSQREPDGYTIPISDFVYARGDMSNSDAVPTIAPGQSLTFKNLDAPLANGIWHTITACRAPCNGATGVAYPLANADIQFDSGELGAVGPPTAGSLTWSTPKDLPPGTYTYFCRIHPGMRGAFRVAKAGA
ncbi:MAG: hypothetical protein JWL83_4607 [Actinomycetia bacterium]|nr:hypothetical protein [Actinomycetes bacterium]